MGYGIFLLVLLAILWIVNRDRKKLKHRNHLLRIAVYSDWFKRQSDERKLSFTDEIVKEKRWDKMTPEQFSNLLNSWYEAELENGVPDRHTDDGLQKSLEAWAYTRYDMWEIMDAMADGV